MTTPIAAKGSFVSVAFRANGLARLEEMRGRTFLHFLPVRTSHTNYWSAGLVASGVVPSVVKRMTPD